jgi:fructokinase
MKKRIAAIGEVLWDNYGDTRYIGGAPFNFSYFINSLGEEGMIISRIGQDEPGEDILKQMNLKQMSAKYVQKDSLHPTGRVSVTLDIKGTPSFIIHRDVAFDYISFEKKLKPLSTDLNAICFGTLAQRNKTSEKTIHLFLQKIKQYNPASLIIFDINIRQNFYSFEMIEASLVKSDILKLNEDEILLLKNLYHKETDDKEFMKWLAEKYNLKLICLTMAEKGALVISADEEIFSPGYRVNAIDTVGSGDAFTAGFVYKYLNNASLQESADFANLMGGYVAEHKGATPPVGKERLEIFRKHRCPVDVC